MQKSKTLGSVASEIYFQLHALVIMLVFNSDFYWSLPFG